MLCRHNLIWGPNPYLYLLAWLVFVSGQGGGDHETVADEERSHCDGLPQVRPSVRVAPWASHRPFGVIVQI
jgi:hypothetical protein